MLKSALSLILKESPPDSWGRPRVPPGHAAPPVELARALSSKNNKEIMQSSGKFHF